jgi:RNA-directed DNA polymerase
MSKLAWKEIDWTLVQKRLSRQQRRVYKASMEGTRHIVHAIQRRIIRSLDARLLSVRRVTIENRGRNTADLDNESGKVLSHKNKIKLVYHLSLDGNANCTRKIYLPRTRTKKKIFKPCSVLTIEDRAKQMLAKLALEPEWDAIFEFNSFGFRPRRPSHNAIASIFRSLRKQPQFILVADIHDGFNEIDYDKLIAKMDTFSLMKKQIKSWLDENILLDVENESNEVSKILEDTFQREIISPLLVNILLHGLENYIKEWYSSYCYLSSNYTSYKRKNDRKNIPI